MAVNFDSDRRPRRQDWPGELVETGMFYMAGRALLLSGHFQNDRYVEQLWYISDQVDMDSDPSPHPPICSCRFVEVDAADALEIDTPDDLQLARLLSQNANPNEPNDDD